MTPKQERAIEALEAAFRKAKRAGLVFIGMDDNLHVFDRQSLHNAGYGLSEVGAIEAMQATGVETVNTAGTYLDSGGW